MYDTIKRYMVGNADFAALISKHKTLIKSVVMLLDKVDIFFMNLSETLKSTKVVADILFQGRGLESASTL